MTRYLFGIYDSIKNLAHFLKLSIISPKFYSKVYSDFTGYGLRYVFILSFIGTITASIFIMTKLTAIRNYYDTRIISNAQVASIDYILSRWQAFDYNGSTISSTESEPIILTTENNKQSIIAIDAEDKMSNSVKRTIPIVFGKSRLIINLAFSGENSQQFSYDYANIFGTSKKTIDREEITKLLKEYMDYVEPIYILIGIPLILALNFGSLIFGKILMVLIVHFVFKTFVNPKNSIKATVRVVAFSIGVAALLQPLSVISSGLGVISSISQLWTSLLVTFTILKMRRREL